MKRKFVTNLALLLFLNLLVKPVWIYLIVRNVMNEVGPESFGFYISLFNFSLVLNILLDVGITNFNNRDIAQHNQLLSKYLSNIVVLKFFLAMVYCIVCVIAAVVVKYDWDQLKLLFWLIFNQFVVSFTLYLRSNLSGLHLFRTDSLISVLDRILLIFIVGGLLLGNFMGVPFKIEWFVYSQTIAYVTTALVTFIIVFFKAEYIRLRIDWFFLLAIMKQSYPFALLVLLMAFYNRIDNVMIERLLPNGRVQSGIYYQAYQNLETASMFAFLFAGLLLPIFARMIKLKESVEQLLQLSFLLLVIPAIIVSITCVIYRNEVIQLLYHHDQKESARIFGMLILGFISVSMTYIFGTLLTANGSLKQLNIMAACGMVLNITLNIILIPRYMAFGSAIASVITQSCTAIAQVLIAKKIFNLAVNYKLLLSLTIFIICVVCFGLLSKQLISSWVVGFLGMIGLSLILAFSLKLINLKTLFDIVRYKEENG